MDLQLLRYESNLFFPTPQQFYESTLSQEFSFHMPIMKYIWSKPSSSKVYQKLIKCCKLFFIKNQILVINNLEYYPGKDYPPNQWIYCIANKCSGKYSCKQKHGEIDMDKINAKIWVPRALSVYSDNTSNFASLFIPKIYRCDANILKLYRQDLTYKDLKILSSDVKEAVISSCTIKYDNGEKVPIENIIQLFHGAKEISMYFYTISYNAACKSYAEFIAACNTIEKFSLHHMPGDFDVIKFYISLKSTKNRTLYNIYSFSDSRVLDEVIDEIIETESFEFVPPVINYHYRSAAKLEKMKEIQAREAAKYQ